MDRGQELPEWLGGETPKKDSSEAEGPKEQGGGGTGGRSTETGSDPDAAAGASQCDPAAAAGSTGTGPDAGTQQRKKGGSKRDTGNGSYRSQERESVGDQGREGPGGCPAGWAGG